MLFQVHLGQGKKLLSRIFTWQKKERNGEGKIWAHGKSEGGAWKEETGNWEDLWK